MLTESQFITTARAQLGDEYKLGTEVKLTDEDPEVWDCSEFIQWLFYQAGTPIRDLAANQYADTRSINDSPHTGDLVFLRNNPARSNGIGHVGVITASLPDGDWETVEAKGRMWGVVRSRLSLWKKRPHFVGPRRYNKLKFLPETPEPDQSAVLVLGPGSRGEPVRRLQQGLLDRFPLYADPIAKTGGADGVFGAGTERVVKEFQSRSGLRQTGRVNANAWIELGKYGITPWTK